MGVRGYDTVLKWLRKFGNFDWENRSLANMPKTPEQRTMELEAKINLLEKQKAIFKKQAFVSDMARLKKS